MLLIEFPLYLSIGFKFDLHTFKKALVVKSFLFSIQSSAKEFYINLYSANTKLFIKKFKLTTER